MMGVPKIPARLCAFNPDHGEATRSLVIGYRVVKVCRTCKTGKAAPAVRGVRVLSDRRVMWSPAPAQVVAAVATSPGVRADDLATRLLPAISDEGDRRRARNAFSGLIKRMVDGGLIACERRGSRDRRLWAVSS